jgi:hypothetical protein
MRMAEDVGSCGCLNECVTFVSRHRPSVINFQNYYLFELIARQPPIIRVSLYFYAAAAVGKKKKMKKMTMKIQMWRRSKKV